MTKREFLKQGAGIALALRTGLGKSSPGGVRAALQAEWLADSHEHTFPEAQRVASRVDLLTLFSHYAINDLRAAGMTGKPVADYLKPDIPVLERWRTVAPYYQKARNTGYVRVVDIALRDLYGVAELNERNCEEVSARITAANTKGIHDRILREKSRIKLVILDDYYNVEPAAPDSSMFVTTRRFDRFISITSADDLRKLEESTHTSFTTFADLERALVNDFEKNRKLPGMVSVKVAVAYQRPIYFREATRQEAERDFERVARNALPPPSPHPAEKYTHVPAKDLQDYMLHRVVQLAREYRYPVQFHTGLHSGGNYFPNSNPAFLLNLLMGYPDVRFVLFHAGYPYLSETAVLAKNFRNAYIDLCWMHILSPSACVRSLAEYLDAVPANKIFGFGGDYRVVELTYGHSVIARENIVRVLEEKVKDGYFTQPQAIEVGKRLLYGNVAEFYTGDRDHSRRGA